MQAFNSSSSLIMKGSASILSGLQVYQAKQWVLHSWRDVFVDLVQGQLQFLFLSLLAGGETALCCCLAWSIQLLLHFTLSLFVMLCLCFSAKASPRFPPLPLPLPLPLLPSLPLLLSLSLPFTCPSHA